MKKEIDKLDALKKSKFVDAYKKTNGNITDSASIAGIARATYYNWLDSDKEFAMQILDSEANLNDEIRQVLIQKAAEGDMTAVIFYLKNRHPDFKQVPALLQQFNMEKGGVTYIIQTTKDEEEFNSLTSEAIGNLPEQQAQ